jgi:indole-3-glycerol phosphate synthase
MQLLEAIDRQKQREVEQLYQLIQQQPQHSIAQILHGNPAYMRTCKSFKHALRQNKLAVIAEIKRQSPSKGLLNAIPDPTLIATAYCDGGAAAISVLTDRTFFKGSLPDLTQVAHHLQFATQPILRKDFIIDSIQIAEAIASDADAILLIVALLGDKTRTLLDYAKNVGIDALVEVHNTTELDIALNSGAEIIGINNRNLSTFAVDTELALRLIEQIPRNIIRVAESGITTPSLAQDYYRAGFDGVLIGEALVQATYPAQFIEACHDKATH